MKFFTFHIGDYSEATTHLTFIEDAAYFRLLRKYYSSEAPLPAEVKRVQRLVGARTKEERAAVETVLEEYFALDDDGWHNARCDEDILRYREKMEGQVAKRDNEKERQTRARAHRKSLAAELAKRGIKVTLRTTTEEMESLLSRSSHDVVTRDDAVTTVTASRGFTRLSHFPSPISHSPSPIHRSGVCVTRDGTAASGTDPKPPLTDAEHQERWLACRAAYPSGIFPQVDWVLAERNARDCVEAGLCEWDQLRAAAERFSDQQRALGRTGTQYVPKPSGFFHRDNRSWDEPFPAPAPGSKPAHGANLMTVEEAEAIEAARAKH